MDRRNPGMMTETRLRTAAASVALAGWLATPTVGGTDRKILPGSACVAMSGTAQSQIDYAAGRVHNTLTTGNVNVICPIVRADPSTGNAFTSFEVHLNAPTTSQEFCYVYCYTNDGSTELDTSEHTVGAGYQTLSFSTKPDPYVDGQCEMECDLHPNGGIVSWYRWEE
jgi:hypothetical protein